MCLPCMCADGRVWSCKYKFVWYKIIFRLLMFRNNNRTIYGLSDLYLSIVADKINLAHNWLVICAATITCRFCALHVLNTNIKLCGAHRTRTKNKWHHLIRNYTGTKKPSMLLFAAIVNNELVQIEYFIYLNIAMI